MISLHTVLFNAAGTTAIQYLGTASTVAWLDDLDGEGTFSFSIPHEDASDISVGSVIKFALGLTSSDYVFAGVVESVRMENTGPATSGIARMTNISGRGVRAKLDDAVIYPVGASNLRTFTAVSAGEVFKTVFDEAQTRGALTGMSLTFSNTLDSNGDAYAETLTVEEAVGATLLDLASRHQEIAVDVWVDPDLNVNYANHRGDDLTTGLNPLVLRVGQSISEMSTQVAGPVRNTLLVASGESASTFDTKFDAPSQSSYGRKESFLSLADTTDAAYITLASEKVLLSTAQPADGVTIQLDPSGPIPYIDFQIGDTVLLADAEGERFSYRVRSITVSQNAAGELFFVPELGTTRADLDRRLQRALIKLERGNAQGESLISNTPPDLNLGGGGGGSDIRYGEVLTYNPTTESGTLDIDGITYNFDNDTGWNLNVGDIVTVVDVVDATDKVVIGVSERAGSYTPIVITNPNVVSGFPYDADGMSPTHLYLTGTWGTAPAAGVTPPVWYGSAGELGIPGRKVVLSPRLSTAAGAGAGVFVIRDIETGTTSAIYHDHPQNASEIVGDIAVSGTKLVVVWGRTANATTDYGVEIYDTATATWTSFPGISRCFLGGISNGFVWLLGCDSRAATSSVQRVISINLSTNAISTSTPASSASGTTGFIKAKNGYIYTTCSTSRISIAPIGGNAASLSWTEITGISGLWNTNVNWSTLSGVATGNLAPFALRNLAYANSDIDPSGNLYVASYTGSPASYGFYKFTPAGVSTSYPNIANAGGVRGNGEPVQISGLAYVNGQIVLAGSVQQNVVNAAWPTNYYSPAYWRGNGVTTNATYDSVNGNNALQPYGIGSTFPAGNAFGFLTRWGGVVTGAPSAAGPGVVNAYTVA